MRKGDFLVIDNAAVHGASDSVEVLQFILDTFGVSLVRMPCYSPELNPCELVFAQIKSRLRYHRGDDSFLEEVLTSISLVSRENIFHYYQRCIFPKFILPDYFVPFEC